MPCYHPLTAWRLIGGQDKSTGKWRITFNPVLGHPSTEMKIPCGQCIGCRLEASRQWAVRCVHEASLHKSNSFITLTYKPDCLPSDGGLHPEHFQKFMKRLRKALPDVKIRYFHCGEYGTLLSRPHYHAIIFGYDFPDKKLWSRRHGVNLFRSALLERLWPFGFSTIGDVTFESCAYVARYILKKQNGDGAGAYYNGKHKEYITMSRRPGIARDWIDKYIGDVYPRDAVIIRNGLKCKPPRYYDYVYDLTSSDDFAKIQIRRKRVGRLRKLSPDVTPERLMVRESLKKLQAAKLVRPLHLSPL